MIELRFIARRLLQGESELARVDISTRVDSGGRLALGRHVDSASD